MLAPDLVPDCLSKALREQLEVELMDRAAREAAGPDEMKELELEQALLAMLNEGQIAAYLAFDFVASKTQAERIRAAFWTGARFGAQFAWWQSRPFRYAGDDEPYDDEEYEEEE